MTRALVGGVVLGALAALGLGACGPSVIDDSPVVAHDAEIPDTDANREIVTLVDEYRRALEDKDLGTLRRIISSDYYENAGTTHTAGDDYGYDGLDELLALFGENVRELRISIRIQQIDIQGDRANVYLDFGYNMLYVIDGQERWQVDQDINRLELVREGDSWRVIAGL